MEIKNRAELFSIAEQSALTAGHKYNNITSVIFQMLEKNFKSTKRNRMSQPMPFS